MSALLIAQVWMLGLGLWARRWLRPRPPGPGGWLALVAVAVLPSLAAGLALLRPEVAVVVADALPAARPVAAALPEIGADASLPSLWTVYASVAALLLLRLLVRVVRLHRTPAQEVAPGLALTDASVPPHALGWPAGRVVVPRALWDDLPVSDRAMLLAHERSHLIRRDPEWTLALLALQAVFWINPGLRALVAGWRQAAEVRADRAALRTHSPRAYAQFFARLARSLAALPAPTATRPHTPGDLAMRLSAIVDPSPARRAPVAALAAGLLAAAATAALAAPAASDALTPIKRVPPVMPTSCPDLSFSDDYPLRVLADTATQVGQDGPVRGMGDVMAEVGRVDVRFDVDVNGVPQNLTVTGLNAECFREPALTSVSQWRFAPGAAVKDVENQLRFRLALADGADIEAELEAFAGR